LRVSNRKCSAADGGGGAEFAGSENDGPKIFNNWKIQDLENDGPNRRAGKCRTCKMRTKIAGLENARPAK